MSRVTEADHELAKKSHKNAQNEAKKAFFLLQGCLGVFIAAGLTRLLHD
jgi:hypothetical protein